MGIILGYEYILPGAFTLPLLTTGLVCMPQSIYECKSPSLLKRIGLSNVNSTRFLFVILSYNFLIIILGMSMEFCISFLVF